MRTITAKELRDNLWEITNRIQAGEHIKVTYREKDVFIIKTSNRNGKKNVAWRASWTYCF